MSTRTVGMVTKVTGTDAVVTVATSQVTKGETVYGYLWNAEADMVVTFKDNLTNKIVQTIDVSAQGLSGEMIFPAPMKITSTFTVTATFASATASGAAYIFHGK